MKYTVEITEEKMVIKFIDKSGREYINTWVVKGPGWTGTLEPKSIDDQMEESERFTFDDNLLEAIYGGDLDDIWEAIRNQY